MISQALWEAKALKGVSFLWCKILVVNSSLASVCKLARLHVIGGACMSIQAYMDHQRQSDASRHEHCFYEVCNSYKRSLEHL